MAAGIFCCFARCMHFRSASFHSAGSREGQARCHGVHEPLDSLPFMTKSFFRAALVLGLLSAIGPFAIDMYLPALPSIGQTLGASMGAVQASLMAFFISLGIGQIIYGPVSDMIGRKAPLYFGLVLFAAGSIGCALAPDVHTLIVLRFIQGLGACAGMVVPRAIVRDLHTGHDAARLMSLLMLVFSVSPILAPLAGSILIESFGWRSVFWAVTVAAAAGLLLVAFPCPRRGRPSSAWTAASAAHSPLMAFCCAIATSWAWCSLARSAFPVFLPTWPILPLC
jgi:multidrug resistance protein